MVMKMSEEIWKDIQGFEGCYQISNFGRVKSLTRSSSGKRPIDQIIKQGYDKDGYNIITLHNAKNGVKRKTFRVHRLVANAFLLNPVCLPEINHIDENKTNNNVNNLEWCTTKYNLTYGHRLDCARGERNDKHKLTKEQVLEIRKIYKKGDLQFGQSALAKKYGVKHQSIADIVNRKSWKHI